MQGLLQVLNNYHGCGNSDSGFMNIVLAECKFDTLHYRLWLPHSNAYLPLNLESKEAKTWHNVMQLYTLFAVF